MTADISLAGADCAEQFDIAGAETIEPGNVVVIDREGALRRSQNAYDKKVAGVISGAGEYRPGLVLDRQQSQENRLPVALVGKVYCKVNVRYSPIEVFACMSGRSLHFYATDGRPDKADATGELCSNTVTTTCP